MKDLITVGLDGTLQSLSAALWAAREAELRKARLRLLHAWIQLGPEPKPAHRPRKRKSTTVRTGSPMRLRHQWRRPTRTFRWT